MDDGVNLIRYDAMTRAIAECHSVDEAKDIRDKAKALEAYMRQRNDTENERKLAVIKLRAARAAGKLLRKMKEAGQMARGAEGTASNQYQRVVRSHDETAPKTLSDLGVTKAESSAFQKIEQIPDAEFEGIIADPEQKLTESAVILAWKPKEKHNNPQALALWGDLRDFERHGLLEEDPACLFDDMLPTMQEDIRRLAPLIAQYLLRLYRESMSHDENLRANVQAR